MDQTKINEILKNLSKRRPVFCSEADFQFELSNEIKSYFKEKNKEVTILLEYYQLDGDSKPMHIDILTIIDGKWYPIELKYKTKGNSDPSKILKYSGKIGEHDYEFGLRNHGAQDIGCYKYLWDVKRIVEIKKKRPKEFEKGYAIMLTNDGCYWNGLKDCIYSEFLITGPTIPNHIKWRKHPDTGKEYAIAKKYPEFRIDEADGDTKTWDISAWEVYSEKNQFKDSFVRDENSISTFKYVICEIK